MIKILCLIGPSACGKDALLQKVLKKSSCVVPVVRYTTRPKRDNEIDGKDYYFISVEEFTKKVLDCQMSEAAEFRDWFYGTGKDTLDKNLVNIMTCDLIAAVALSEDPELFVSIVYVETDAKERLLRSLKREKDPNVNEVIRRFIDDEKKYSSEQMSDIAYFTVKNNSKTQMKNAVGEICNIIGGMINECH